MKGDIYTREKCWCGERLKHSYKKDGCVCPKHPKIKAKKIFVRFENVFVNYSAENYSVAFQFLSGLRAKFSDGTFDPRDYQADAPLGFRNLSEKWLKFKGKPVNRKGRKTRTISKDTLQSYRNYMNVAQSHWENKNIKNISDADIEDFISDIPNISEKTRRNYFDCYRQFWKWATRRERFPLPDFEEIVFTPELEYRPITNFKTQGKILDKVYEISTDNPKIWLGCDMLATYTNIRPADLCKMTEGDFDLESKAVIIRFPSKVKNKTKVVRLVDRHVGIIAGLKEKHPALPHVLFFRHAPEAKYCITDNPFYKNLFYKYWVKAGVALGAISKGNIWICGECEHEFETETKKSKPCPKCKSETVYKKKQLDLYGATRHTTTTEIAKALGEKKAKAALGNTANKSIERYCQWQDDDTFDVVKDIENLRTKKEGEVIKFGDKK